MTPSRAMTFQPFLSNSSTILFVLTTILFSSCSTVVSKHPIGLETYTTPAAQWDGTWLSTADPIHIQVIDPNGGIVRLMWIETKENEPTIESVTLQIRKGQQWLYANVVEMENTPVKQDYYWGRITKEDNQIIFWLPSTDAVKAAVETQELKGSIKQTETNTDATIPIGTSETILLHDTPDKIVAVLEESGGRFFDWEHPVVLIKLKPAP